MRLSPIVLAVLSVLGCVLHVGGHSAREPNKKPPRPPKPEQLVGVWTGFWEDGNFTRLELRSDSTGYCAFVAPPQGGLHEYGVEVYRVTHWSLDAWRFIVTLTPANARSEEVYLKGDVWFDKLELEIGGMKRKWKQKLVLHNDSQMQVSNSETRNAIEEAEKK